jgi:hypothetical protein
MLTLAKRQTQAQTEWVDQRKRRIDTALSKLDADFKVLLPKP